jgi:DNA-binding transcriptional MerR regulator
MVRKSALRLQSSRKSGHKSANSGNSAPAPARSLKIGEAARLLGVEAYVLRFWETQFPDLRPYHTASKHRLYQPEDIETLRKIKHLLYEEGFTIEGARKRIKELATDNAGPKAAPVASRKATKALAVDHPAIPPAAAAERQALIQIRRDLESIYRILMHQAGK